VSGPRLKAVPTPTDGIDAIDTILRSLSQAYATVDLLFTLATEVGPQADTGFGLCNHSLVNALDSIMVRFEVARSAAERVAEVHS
jgi:hypothetical protein